ncbi:DUF6603 domain-containing protein [Sorangium sp. So ce381]|uniref:DUF6603 domain-containing protein n=1 Tax=Sorangium sp. So ce381 TaxID=3133307 RepID=UPI003F5B3ECD
MSNLTDVLQRSLKGSAFALKTGDLQSPAIDAIAGDFFPNAVLSLTQARLDVAADGTAVVRGTGVDLPLTGMSVEARFYDRDGHSHFQLTATAGAGFTLTAALPALASPLATALRFASPPTLTLHTDPQSAAGAPGMALAATIDLKAMTAGLSGLLGRDSLPLSGSIVIKEQGSKLHDVHLIAPAVSSVNLGFAEANDVTLSIGMRLAYDPWTRAFGAIPWLGLATSITLGTGDRRSPPIPLSLETTSLGGPLRFQADVGDGIAAALDDLEALVQHVGLASLLRAQTLFRVADSVRVTTLFFDLDIGGGGGLTGIGVALESASPWNLLHIDATGADLTVSTLKVTVTLARPFSLDNARVSVGGEVALGAGTMVVNATFPDLAVQGYLRQGSGLALGDLLALFLGASAPAPALALDVLTFDASSAGYSLDVTIDGTWWLPLGGALWGVEEAALSIVRRAQARSARVSGLVRIADVLIEVAVDVPGPGAGWTFSGSTAPDQVVVIGRLLDELSRQFGLALPSALTDLVLDALAFTFDSNSGRVTFGCDGRFTIADHDVAARIRIAYADSAAGVTASTSGTLTIGAASFTLAFDMSPGSRRVSASWSSARPTGFADIAGALGVSLPLPPELDLGLVRASLAYDFASVALLITARSASYGNAGASLVSRRDADGGRWYAFVFQTHVAIDLGNVPVVGAGLPAARSIGLHDLRFTVVSKDLDARTVADVNASLRAADPDAGTLPTGPARRGVLLAVPITMGSDSALLVIPLDGAAARLTAPPPVAAGDSMKWLDVQRAFGPVWFQRLGLGYAGGQIEVALDASLTFAGLTVSLMGLRVTSPLSSFSPSFHLDGLGINLSESVLNVSGTLLALPDRGIDSASPQYAGQVVVETEAFGVASVGEFSNFQGQPTFFFFAMLDAPLGGPAFAFVTGLALGLGFNRRLILPSLDALPKFPLVAAALADTPSKNPFHGKTDPAAALEVMSDAIPISLGDSWLALGVRFTSFELVHSFALLTATFGARFEIDLLGLSMLAVPSNAPDPIGFAEMALEASFSPDEGMLAVDGKLTPASYILSRDCHLTGGFALRAWFRDTADASAGDFLVTLGGYHPAFARPARYPLVPRVGVNWRVSDELTVKGDFYFALTPAAVMAGGSMEAVWQSGDLKAWFSADADFLLSWRPFYYRAHVAVSLGASYKVDLWITSFTVTVRVGVDLDFWGPSFAGRATVDLYVVSFTISFGDSDPSPEPISWSEFKSSFLPKGSASPSPSPRGARSGGDPPPIPIDTYCSSRVASGLLQDLSGQKRGDDDPDWIVNPETLVLETHSAMPSTEASYTTGDAANAPRTTPLSGEWSRAVGVGPVAVAAADFVSRHAISIFRLDGDAEDYHFPVELAATPIKRNVPSAPWSPSVALNPNLTTLNAGAPMIADTLSGFRLSAPLTAPDQTPVPVRLAILQTTPHPHQGQGAWSAPKVATGDPFDQGRAMDVLTSTVNDARKVASTRVGILAALRAQGVTVDPSVNVDALAAHAADVLLSAPVLSYLGEEPARAA